MWYIWTSWIVLDGLHVDFLASAINPRDTLFQLRPLSRPLAAAVSSTGARQPLEQGCRCYSPALSFAASREKIRCTSGFCWVCAEIEGLFSVDSNLSWNRLFSVKPLDLGVPCLQDLIGLKKVVGNVAKTDRNGIDSTIWGQILPSWRGMAFGPWSPPLLQGGMAPPVSWGKELLAQPCRMSSRDQDARLARHQTWSGAEGVLPLASHIPIL